MTRTTHTLSFFLAFLFMAGPVAADVRLKDVARVRDRQEVQLIVYGLVVTLIIWGLTRAQPAIRMELLFCVGSLGMFLVGVIKHQRWRRWVRTLPNPLEAPSSEAEK